MRHWIRSAAAGPRSGYSFHHKFFRSLTLALTLALMLAAAPPFVRQAEAACTAPFTATKIWANGMGGTVYAQRDDGSIWAWGWNYYGQLSSGTSGSNTNALQPVQVLEEVVESDPEPISGMANSPGVFPGPTWAFAVTADDTLKAWGFNNEGQLGTGATVPNPVPLAVTIGSGIAESLASTGSSATAAVRGGNVFAWGNGSNLELAQGLRADSLTPVQVRGA
ncbi:MAG TPA: hypothetical protein VD902_22765, partial [Symbiobacteriaceae bacterium]|nr:hypothetical protein [Symbiobacteriaceae bacterium]